MQSEIYLDESRVYDAVIIGAGGAGMCLLYAMHTKGYLQGHRLLILEPEPKAGNDRTWCFWAKADEPVAAHFGPWASQHWGQAWVGQNKQSLHPYRYYHLRSADLYRQVKEKIRACPLVSWQALRAEAVTPMGEWVCVEAGGESYFARRVFDSRIDEARQALWNEDKDMVWQSFWGMRVRLPGGVKDEAAIRLMDFDVPQEGTTQFMYVLPTAADEALIELTRFGVEPIAHHKARPLLEAWVERRFGTFEVLETESGCIPMSLQLNPPKPCHDASARVIPIGTSAGAVKGSTGYALRCMFDHAMSIVDAIEVEAPLPTPYHGRRFAFYDALLLHILAHRPYWGKPIFEKLFERVPLHRVLPFMDEKTNLRQEIPLLLSLPLKPFLWALLQVYVLPVFTGAPKTNAVESRLRGAIPLLLAALALALQWVVPDVLQAISPPLLLLGMVFPGIPHGAIDHCLRPEGQMKGLQLIRFIASYLLIMLFVLILWVFQPLLGIAFFLLYSAWHFGETDVRHWQAFSRPLAWGYGVSVLAFILASHPEAFAYYLETLGVAAQVAFPPLLMTGISIVSLGGLILTGVSVASPFRGSWFQTVLILVSGAFLPLLPAFGLYFIGVHSFRGWAHLQSNLQMSSGQLWRKALPFSMGAYALFVLFLALDHFAELPFEGMIPGLFIFLAAISAPHIWYMHRFYQSHA